MYFHYTFNLKLKKMISYIFDLITLHNSNWTFSMPRIFYFQVRCTFSLCYCDWIIFFYPEVDIAVCIYWLHLHLPCVDFISNGLLWLPRIGSKTQLVTKNVGSCAHHCSYFECILVSNNINYLLITKLLEWLEDILVRLQK